MNLIFLGDSLMQPNDFSTFPQEGWPQELHYFLKDPVDDHILDFALNGRSTKSFIDEGRFGQAVEASKKGDIAIISFGHNDEKKQDKKRFTDPFGEYQKNLAFMVRDFAARGCSSIFVTSMTRLKYDEQGVLIHSHGDYPKAMKEEAVRLGIPCIDLEDISYRFLAPGPFESNRPYYMSFKPGEYPNYPEGSSDTSHLTEQGAKMVCRLLLPEFHKIPLLDPLFL
jgi:lysophospholipase L1-like esterase